MVKNLVVFYKDWCMVVVFVKGEGVVQLGFIDGMQGCLFVIVVLMLCKGGGVVFDWINFGDVIVVVFEGGDWLLCSILEVLGGMVVQNFYIGQILVMQGGFDLWLGSFNWVM